MQFTIDRSIWLRGEGPGGSCLLRERDQRMCCLGIFMRALGVERDRLAARAYPREVQEKDGEQFPDWLMAVGTKPSASAIAEINDDAGISDRQREQLLEHEFRKQGVQVTFIDGKSL